MKGGNAPLGYTIIEVMIVLAISGFMFAIAANFINGKQATTAFSSGSSEMISRLQGVIEQVRDGRYSDIAFTCTRSATDPPSLTIDTATTSAGATSYTGTQAGCTFIGKFVHFPIGVGANQELTDYRVFSLAGAQAQANGNPVTTLAQAGPTVIRSVDGSTDLTTEVSTPQNLDVKSVRVNNGAAWLPAYGFGFVQGLGSVDSTVNPSAYLSGSQTIRLVYAPGITKDDNQLEAAATGLKIENGGLTEIQGAEICFTDGTRHARISVGVNQEDAASAQKDAPLTIKRKMLGRTAC